MPYISTGRIISTGTTTYLPLPYGCDKFEIENATVRNAAGAGSGINFRWYKGMPARSALQDVKTAGNVIAPADILVGGFTEYNSSDDPNGPLQATITAIAGGGVPPVVTAIGHGLITGDTVRLINTLGALQLANLDFTVTYINPNSFTLTNMQPIVASVLAGSFRLQKYAPIFYPSARIVTKIAPIPATTTTLVTFSVTHTYTVGQVLDMVVPNVFGMTQMNGLSGTILAVGVADADGATNTVTLDIDSSAFTPFVFPLTGVDFTPAQAVPAGKNVNAAFVATISATHNEATFGLMLEAGVNSPAGAVGDVLLWTSFKNDND
jgi:hypothetical protein